MHLYKHFFKLIGKNKSGLIIYGCIFIAMIFCIVLATSSVESESDSVKTVSYTIGYIDKDNSELSRGILDFLAKDNELVDMSDKDEDGIKTIVFFETVKYVFEIPEGFEADIAAGRDTNIEYYVGTSMSARTYIISNYIDKYLKNYKAYIELGKSETEAIKAANANMENVAKVNRYVDDEKVTSENGSEIAVYNLINFFAYVSFGAIVVCLGGVLLTNNQKGVSKRMFIAPVSAKNKVLVDFIGVFTAGIIIWAVFMIFMAIYGRNSQLMSQYFGVIMLLELAIIVFNCSFAVFVAGFGVKNATLGMISNVVGLSMSFVSGVFVPQYLLGSGVLAVAKFTPFYWLCRCVGTMYGPAESPFTYSASEVALSISMILLIAVVFLSAGILVRKQKAAN